nr:PREDICTED: cytochrome b5 reductase 4 isoform X2 [Latimeria chalumnae]|eukprot:XP_014343350.1 PREDICTED: cytochrome b5 reductase 4 isoform X2 [Latimeria chalumnae]
MESVDSARMLNFPAPKSQQRVSSSSGRSKVPLKPGRSLMDWIRLTKSGKDLTGLKGRLIEVTEEELAKHNKKDDCWICIRGLVYDVTPYMEYHPGGEDELMKAAGADGTELFDQVHRWVNYESMLKECLVGRMALKPASVAKEIQLSSKEQKKTINGMSPSEKLSKDTPPRYDWFQTELVVTVVIYTKQKDIVSESVIVDLEDDQLRAETRLTEYSYLLHLKLSYKVQEDISVHIAGKVGKIELNMKKTDRTTWNELGRPLKAHNSFTKHKDQDLFYRKCKLVAKNDIAYNTKLFCLQLPLGTHLQVPIGQHVYLKHTIEGIELVRPYTPVCHSLQPELQEATQCTSRCIYLMIKIYPAGAFTSKIDSLQIGEDIDMSNPTGNFNKSQLQGVKHLFLLAAGTGFTPMANLLRYAVNNNSSLRKIKLMFFNRTENDILWRDQLKQLDLKEQRFAVEFVLSEPTEGWIGKQGKISLPLLSDFINTSTEGSKPLICICGPSMFTEQGIRETEKKYIAGFYKL